jgi:hypothetical protein
MLWKCGGGFTDTDPVRCGCLSSAAVVGASALIPVAPLFVFGGVVVGGWLGNLTGRLWVASNLDYSSGLNARR